MIFIVKKYFFINIFDDYIDDAVIFKGKFVFSIVDFWEEILKMLLIFCFYRVFPFGRSFNSSRFGLKCIKPSSHLPVTLALTLTLTLKPPPTTTSTLTLPLTQNKNLLRK